MGQIRVAQHRDVPELVEFIKEYHATKSNLKDIPFEAKTMTNTLHFFIETSKHVVYLYEDDEIEGIIMGSVEPFPHNSKYTWASDTLFIANSGGAYLLRRFVSWAKAMRAKRIYMAVSTGDPTADHLYQASGMEYMGGMYRVVCSEAHQEGI